MARHRTASKTKQVPENESNTIPSWDEYFLKLAKVVATKSKDPSQVGAVLVNDNIVIATGYNGLPRSVSDLPERTDNKEEKLPWVVHAEMNAICNAARIGVSLLNATLYVTRFPCCDCAGQLVQAGIMRVVTSDKKMWQHNPTGDKGERSIRIFCESGVQIHADNMPLAYTSASANDGSIEDGR